MRHTARLSQRYSPIARYGAFGVSTWPIGCDTPSPFSEHFPLGEHAKWRCDTTHTRVGRTPKGAYSTRGRSRHLLETPFSEPLLRTLLRTPFYCKTHRRPPLLRTLLRTPSPEPFPEPSQNPSQNAVLPYAPLGVHPKGISQRYLRGFCKPFFGHSAGPTKLDRPNRKRLQKQGQDYRSWPDLNQEWPRQTKPKKGQFMNFSQRGIPAQKFDICVNRACFPKEKHTHTHQNSHKNGRNS